MIGGPKKEGQTENIRFADKAGERGHVGAIDVDSSSTRLLEGCFLLAQYASWINDHAMPALRPVTHELAHVNERSRCRVITRLGVGCSKLSRFGRGLSRILRPRRQRPPRRRATEQRYEVPPPHAKHGGSLPDALIIAGRNCRAHMVWRIRSPPDDQAIRSRVP